MHSRSESKWGGHMQPMVLDAVNELIQVLSKSTASVEAVVYDVAKADARRRCRRRAASGCGRRCARCAAARASSSGRAPDRLMTFVSIPEPEMFLPISSTISRSTSPNGMSAFQRLTRASSSSSRGTMSEAPIACTSAVVWLASLEDRQPAEHASRVEHHGADLADHLLEAQANGPHVVALGPPPTCRARSPSSCGRRSRWSR